MGSRNAPLRRILLLNWKPDIGRSWASVAAGSMDGQIDRLAAHIKATFPEKFFMVIHHEPEEEVRPAAGSGYTADDFRNMFRHVVKRFRADGVHNALFTVVEDTCGRHDTIGGACAQESNVIRYGMHTRHQHACRETFLRYGATVGIGPRDLTHNINFFMNVPVGADGGLTFADGVSAPGKYVDLFAERDFIVLISNCPQLNNPCNGWNPTPIRLLCRVP